MSDPIAVVSISGGKDSLATALVAIDTYGHDRVRLVHAWTGHEHPLTDEYVRDYLPRALNLPIDIVQADFTIDFARKRTFIQDNWAKDGVPQDRIDGAVAALYPTGNPFLDLCLMKGMFPRRKAQFCTEELKRYPLDRYIIALSREVGLVESWQGVRRDESPNRRDALAREKSDGGWEVVRPIVEWTAKQAIAYATARGIEQNPLYRLGMKRVGCMPCINCGKDELMQISKRWPEEIARVARWEQLVSVTGKKGAATLLQRLNHEPGSPRDEIFRKERIETAVLWSRTSRGGVQYDLERSLPATECSSVYGLCE